MVWTHLVWGGDVAVVTVPKAGTYLIKKLLEQLGGDCPIYHVDEFYESKTLQEQYSKRILLVRDPRDVCVSWVRYVVSGKADQVDQNIKALSSAVKEHWRALGMDKQLEYVIRGNSPQAREAGVHPTLIYFPLFPYQEAARHAKDEGTLVCKFENLIGPQGGGSLSAQRSEVEKILCFLQIEVEAEKLQSVLEGLFGGTRTFSHGQIGGWKKVLSRENHKLFKKRHEKLLLTFGYPT